jgi:hypothetical protein
MATMDASDATSAQRPTVGKGWKIAVVCLSVLSVAALGMAVYGYAHQKTEIESYIKSHRAALRGPRGAAGPAGKQGAPGAQGAQGEQGPAGAPGAAGTSGTTAAVTHQVCTTTGPFGTPGDPFNYRPAVTTCHDVAGP